MEMWTESVISCLDCVNLIVLFYILTQIFIHFKHLTVLFYVYYFVCGYYDCLAKITGFASHQVVLHIKKQRFLYM